jgi:hypothetical protein
MRYSVGQLGVLRPEIAIYITSPHSKHLQRHELRRQSKSLLGFPPFASAIASIDITSDFLHALAGMLDMFRAGWVFYSSDVRVVGQR